jgi:DNA (cytosine-5)-methyltransferase 1
MRGKLTCGSLFSGAGGLDYGFKNMGFRIEWAVDCDRAAAAVYSNAIGVEPVVKRVERVRSFPECDVLLAGPPCQGYSFFGKRNEDDPRNTLYREVARALREARPLFFAFENVLGMLHLYGGKFFKLAVKSFEETGYNVVAYGVNALDFGVAQERKRLIIVGFRKDLYVEYTLPGGGPQRRTIRDALNGLPEPDRRDVCWSPFNAFYLSRNRRRDWDEPSLAIPAWDRHVPLHPSSPPLKMVRYGKWVLTAPESEYRRFSYIECIRLQGLPKKIEDAIIGLEYPLRRKYRLAGDAVPTPMAEAVAKSILQAGIEQGRHGSLKVAQASGGCRLLYCSSGRSG